MKDYFRVSEKKPDGTHDFVKVGIDVVLGDALLDLVDSGIDEDAHFRGAWQQMDGDDANVLAMLENPMVQARVIEYVRLALIEKLREAVQDRVKEAERVKAKSAEPET